MRWAIAAVLLLMGCTGFHPLHPKWRDKNEPGVARQPESLVDASSRRPAAASPWQTIGHSHRGRPIRIRRIGHGPRRVIWIGGIHGNEQEGVISTRELPLAFTRVPGALGEVTLTIVEDINPDGTAMNRRGNAKGIDLNRNYPARNFVPGKSYGARPLDQPEARALHDLVRSERPHLVIVAHSWREDHFINFDGPAVQYAELFAAESGYRVKPSDRISPTPGSLGSWVGRTLGIPILTLEYERGSNPLRCWMDTRAAILAVILST